MACAQPDIRLNLRHSIDGAIRRIDVELLKLQVELHLLTGLADHIRDPSSTQFKPWVPPEDQFVVPWAERATWSRVADSELLRLTGTQFPKTLDDWERVATGIRHVVDGPHVTAATCWHRSNRLLEPCCFEQCGEVAATFSSHHSRACQVRSQAQLRRRPATERSAVRQEPLAPFVEHLVDAWFAVGASASTVLNVERLPLTVNSDHLPFVKHWSLERRQRMAQEIGKQKGVESTLNWDAVSRAVFADALPNGSRVCRLEWSHQQRVQLPDRKRNASVRMLPAALTGLVRRPVVNTETHHVPSTNTCSGYRYLGNLCSCHHSAVAGDYDDCQEYPGSESEQLFTEQLIAAVLPDWLTTCSS